jgi:hypothetical protein
MIRTAARFRRALPLLGLLVAAAGCPLAHDNPTPTRCFNDSDCFQAAGEYCYKVPGGNKTEGICRLKEPTLEPAPDKGVPDKGPLPDLGPGPDGDLGADGDLGTTDGDLGPATDADLGPATDGPDSGGTNG